MKLKVLTTVAAAVAAVTVSAHANPLLYLQSGAASTTVVGSAGVATFVDVNFGGWAITIDSGVSAPGDGAPGASLDLSAQDVTGVGAQPLTIEFSSAFYTGPGAATATLDSINAPTGDLFTTFFGLAPFSGPVLTPTISTGSSYGFLPPGGPYWVTEKLVLGGGNPGLTDSADALLTLNVPDGGTTAILLGGAMAGLTLFRSKSRKNS